MTADKRVEVLKEILLELHDGASPESVQERFNETFKDVSAIEIALMEQKLVFNDDNDITYEDVLELCNVHANLFKDKVDNSGTAEADLPGHPVRVYKNENAALQGAMMRIENIFKALDEIDLNEEPGILRGLINQYKLVGQFDKHYNRKENVFFPFLEQYGYDAPPKVMWAKDDEIRDLFNTALKEVKKLPNDTNIASVIEAYRAFEYEFKEMIFKEEAILLNMLLEALSSEDWYQIAQESDIYGYTILPPEEEWIPDWFNNSPTPSVQEQKTEERTVENLTLDQIKTKPAISTPKKVKEPAPIVHPIEQTTSFSKNQPTQIEAYKLPTQSGQLIINVEPNAYSTSIDYDAIIVKPFTHGELSLNQIQWIFDYMPFKFRFFDENGIYRYTNTKDGDIQLPIYQDNRLDLDLRLVYTNEYALKVLDMVFKFKQNDDTIHSFYTEIDGKAIYTQFIPVYNDAKEYLGFVQSDEEISDLQAINRPIARDISPIEPNAKIISKSMVVSQPNTTNSSFETKQVTFNGATITLTYQGNQQVISPEELSDKQRIQLQGGALTLPELNGIFNSMQGEFSFVNKEWLFTFYNDYVDTEDMFFKRNPAQLNRDLEFCHPPKLWPMVDDLVKSFEQKKKQEEMIWFTKSSTGEFVHTAYRPLFDGDMNYQGVLEIVRDIQNIRNAKMQLDSFN